MLGAASQSKPTSCVVAFRHMLSKSVFFGWYPFFEVTFKGHQQDTGSCRGSWNMSSGFNMLPMIGFAAWPMFIGWRYEGPTK